MENRQYQQDMQAEARSAMLAGHRSILIQLATGGGKTRLAADMIYKAINKGHTVHFGVHRDLLVRQTAATFKEHQIPFSYIASGYSHNPHNRVHIVSLDTIKRRVDRPDYKFPSLLFFDEGHLGGAAGYSKVIDAYKAAGCYIVLLSATPWRLSGEGLGRHCSYMVKGPPMSWLIEQGFLSRYRFFSPSSPDMSGLHTRMGEYVKEEVEARMDSVLIGDAVKHYLKAAPHSLNITYCVSRKRSEETAQAFRDAGVPAMHIDGLTPQADRDRIIKAYARRELRVLTNVELITTGFDLASQVGMDVNVESISLLRPTQSLSLYLQQVGRGLRRKSTPAVILDHANCRKQHGFPDDDHNWTLSDREKKAATNSTTPVRHCPQCFFDHRPAPKCPNCGMTYEIKYREVEQIEGELLEVDKEAIKQQNKLNTEAYDNQWKIQSLDDLIKEGYRRGYARGKCEAWAAKVFTAREAKRRGKK
jgi:superfamily II DNA or RNA helicase